MKVVKRKPPKWYNWLSQKQLQPKGYFGMEQTFFKEFTAINITR